MQQIECCFFQLTKKIILLPQSFSDKNFQIAPQDKFLASLLHGFDYAIISQDIFICGLTKFLFIVIFLSIKKYFLCVTTAYTTIHLTTTRTATATTTIPLGKKRKKLFSCFVTIQQKKTAITRHKLIAYVKRRQLDPKVYGLQ